MPFSTCQWPDCNDAAVVERSLTNTGQKNTWKALCRLHRNAWNKRLWTTLKAMPWQPRRKTR